MLHKFRIGRAQCAYNFGDADKVAAYEDALRSAGVLLQNVPANVPESEQIRYTCTSIMGVFDTLFGDGTAKRIFGDTCDLVRATQALAELVAAQRAGAQAVAQEMLKLREVIAAPAAQ